MIPVDQFFSRNIAAENITAEAQEIQRENGFDKRLCDEAEQDMYEYEVWHDDFIASTVL